MAVTHREISAVVRFASKALAMAQRLVALGEKAGLEATRRRRRRKARETAATKPRRTRKPKAGPSAAREEE